MSPFTENSSAQNFARKRSVNACNSNRGINEPIDEDEENSGIINSRDLGSGHGGHSNVSNSRQQVMRLASPNLPSGAGINGHMKG